MKTLTVDVRCIERVFGFDLHQFEEGHVYPAIDLMDAMGLIIGTPQGRPRGNTKGKEKEE